MEVEKNGRKESNYKQEGRRKKGKNNKKNTFLLRRKS